MLAVTAPDNVLVSGRLTNGAVASVHVASIPWNGEGYRMEIFGREGTLVATAPDSPQLSEVQLHGAKGNANLERLDIPDYHIYVPESMPKGAPYNVGQMYAVFAQAIRSGKASPLGVDFDTAVEMHRLLDVLRESSSQGRQLAM